MSTGNPPSSIDQQRVKKGTGRVECCFRDQLLFIAWGGGGEGARGVGGFLGGSLHFLREQKVVGGGVIRN